VLVRAAIGLVFVTEGIQKSLDPVALGAGRFAKIGITDHARYLDAWFEAMNLGEVVIVGHDWGGALGMDWASRHRDRVRGIAVVETFLRPVRWDELTPLSAELFRGYRSAKGEEMVLENNMLVEVNLGRNVMRPMSDADLAVYRAPYPTPASRLPMLQWTREFPLDGEPADVAEIVRAYGAWMGSTPNVPKLVMAVENGSGLGSPEMVRWAAEHFANTVVHRSDRPAIKRRKINPSGSRQRSPSGYERARARRACRRRRSFGRGAGDRAASRSAVSARVAHGVATRERRGRDAGDPHPHHHADRDLARRSEAVDLGVSDRCELSPQPQTPDAARTASG
jgi:haloalkane dehalogenase